MCKGDPLDFPKVANCAEEAERTAIWQSAWPCVRRKVISAKSNRRQRYQYVMRGKLLWAILAPMIALRDGQQASEKVTL